MTKHLIDEFKACARNNYPKEACGVVINHGGKTRFVECRNDSELPNAQFIMNADDYMAACDMGEIVAIWHSHPEYPAKPSFEDEAGCNRSEVPWFILGIYKQGDGSFEFSELVEVVPNSMPMPYVDRPYVFGTYDCYTLVCDYYSREFQIELGEYPRVPEFWNKGLDLFTKGFPEQGFVELEEGLEYQNGDLIIMQIGGELPNHIAIYTDNGVILHHPHGRLSRQDVFGGIWAKHMTHCIRHKTRC